MIEYGSPDDSKRKLEDMQQRYKNVFGTPEGRIVLGHILGENHFGVPLNSDVERIEYNVAIAIARMSGIMGAIDNQLGIVEE